MTGASGEIAELLGEQSLDAAQVGIFEASPEAGIRRDTVDERVRYGRNTRLAAQSFIECRGRCIRDGHMHGQSGRRQHGGERE